MKGKKILVFIALLVSISMIVASCAPAATPSAVTEQPTEAQPVVSEPTKEPEPTQAPKVENAKITLYTTGGATQVECLNNTVVGSFMNENPNIQVEVIEVPQNWDQAIKTMLAGGGGPDIISELGPSTVIDMAKAGQVLPLDQYVDLYGWKDRFAPWALNTGIVDGKYYMLPSQIETLILYYDKTLFEEKGWTPPKTIDELIALGETVKKAGLNPYAAGGHPEWQPENEWFMGEFLNHVPQIGPQAVYDALNGKIKWTDPEFAKATQILADMMMNGWFGGSLDRYMANTFAEKNPQLAEGKAAMMIEGTWAISGLVTSYKEANNGKDWDWVPMPSTSGETYYDLAIGTIYAINKNSKNPDAAAKYLDYLFSPEQQAILFDKCGLAPGPVPFDKTLTTNVDPRWVDALSKMNEAAKTGNYGYTTWTFWPSKTQQYLITEVEKVWTGNITVDEYLKGMQEVFDKEFEAGSVPPIPTR
jgi:raffinose/stachyose/melibiose transport system substrate-binding protein